MDNREIVAVLNELLSLETQTYLARLSAADPFISRAMAGKYLALRSVAAEDAEHEHWLIDEIYRLDGAPRPRSLAIETGRGHYLDPGYLLPAIAGDERRLLEAYKQAQAMVPAGETTGRLLARIAARHEEHLERMNGADG